MAGGISTRMVAVEIGLADGRHSRLIVRQPGGFAGDPAKAVTREFGLLRHLRQLGLPVPQPRLLDAAGRYLGTPALVVDHVDGEPRFDAEDGPRLAFGFAAALATIHAVDGSAQAFDDLPRTDEVVARRLARVPGVCDDSVGEAAIRSVLAQQQAPPSPTQPVLLHGDFWPGNVIWAGEQVAAVIDWEEPAVGDPLADLGTTRLDLLWVFGAQTMADFTGQYQKLRPIDTTALPYWDLCAALRPAGRLSAWAAAYPELGRPDVTSASMRAGHRWFVEQALTALPSAR